MIAGQEGHSWMRIALYGYSEAKSPQGESPLGYFIIFPQGA